MSDTPQRHGGRDTGLDNPDEFREATGWFGLVLLAGIMLVLLGVFQAFEGVVAIVKDDYYLVAPTGLLVTVDHTAWGWTHMIIGAVAIATGIGIVVGQVWTAWSTSPSR